MPHLSNKLRRQRTDIVGLSETRMPVGGEISGRADPGMEDDACLRRATIGVSIRLQPFFIVVDLVDEHLMRPSLKYNVGCVSFIAVHASTKLCENKEMFYAILNFVSERCPLRDALIITDDFSDTTGTERAGHELCVSFHGFGTTNINTSLLNFARHRRVKIAASLSVRPLLQRRT